jgi:hypothetical protein
MGDELEAGYYWVKQNHHNNDWAVVYIKDGMFSQMNARGCSNIGYIHTLGPKIPTPIEVIKDRAANTPHLDKMLDNPSPTDKG